MNMYSMYLCMYVSMYECMNRCMYASMYTQAALQIRRKTNLVSTKHEMQQLQLTFK